MSSKLLEILGRGISVDISEVIRQWLINIEFAATDPHESLTKIFSLMGDMDSAAAEEHLRKYLSEYPSCVHGRLAAAAVCIRNNQLGRAIAELNLVYTKQPNNTIALYAMGYCCERMGREEQALEFYQDCLKFKSHLQLPRQRLAAIYFKNGQFERTVQEYETLRNEYPDDIATLVILGYLYIASGKYAKAGETFNAAILMHPDNFLSENDDIDRLMQEGMLQEALSELDGLADHEYNSVSTLVKRADILSMLGNADEAISQYQEAVRICPDLMDATIKLGAQYLRMDQEHLAASQFNKAVEMNDQIIDAYMGLASAAQLAGDASEAATVLSLASAILPNSILLFAEAATLQFKAGMEEKLMCKVPQDGLNNLIEAVIDAHRREMLLHPQSPDVSYRLALLLIVRVT